MCSRKKADSNAQAAGTAAQPLGTLKVQTTCPVKGGTIDKAVYVDYQGKRIYACCPGCLPQIQREPAKYVAKLEAQGIRLDRVPGQ